jgi:hypothetical protein
MDKSEQNSEYSHWKDKLCNFIILSMQEQAELRFTYRPSPANYKVFVHLFISFFKVRLLIVVSFCVNICNKNKLFDSYLL